MQYSVQSIVRIGAVLPQECLMIVCLILDSLYVCVMNAELLNKPADQLVMNQADSYRQTQELRYIIDRTIPTMDYGKGCEWSEAVNIDVFSNIVCCHYKGHLQLLLSHVCHVSYVSRSVIPCIHYITTPCCAENSHPLWDAEPWCSISYFSPKHSNLSHARYHFDVASEVFLGFVT